MKRILLTAFAVVAASSLWAQQPAPVESAPQARRQINRDSLPYKLYPELPAFNIRLTDSFTIFNTFHIAKGKPSIIILFDPDCKHCKMFTEEFMKQIDKMADVNFYWVTHNASNTMLKDFAAKHNFANYPQIKVVGRDYEFFFLDYYGVRSLPSIVVYDKNKMVVKLFEGNATFEDLYQATHTAK